MPELQPVPVFSPSLSKLRGHLVVFCPCRLGLNTSTPSLAGLPRINPQPPPPQFHLSGLRWPRDQPSCWPIFGGVSTWPAMLLVDFSPLGHRFVRAPLRVAARRWTVCSARRVASLRNLLSRCLARKKADFWSQRSPVSPWSVLAVMPDALSCILHR